MTQMDYEMNYFGFMAMSYTSSGVEIYSEKIEMIRYYHTPMQESLGRPLDMMEYLAMEEEVFNPSEEDLPPIPSWYSTRNQQIDYEMNSFGFMAMSYTSSGEEIYSENTEMIRYYHTPMEQSWTTPSDMMEYLAAEEEVFNPSDEDLPPIPSWYSTRNQQMDYEMNSFGFMAMSYTSSGEQIYSENTEMMRHYHTPMEESWTTPLDMMGYLAAEEEVFNLSDEDLQPSPSWYSARNQKMDYEENSFGFIAMSETSSGEEIYSNSIEMIRYNHTPMEESSTLSLDMMGYLAMEEEVFNPSEEDLPPIPSWYSTRNQKMDYEMNSFDLMTMSETSSGEEIYFENIEMIRNNHTPMEKSWKSPLDMMGYLEVEEEVFNPSDEDLPPIPSWYSTRNQQMDYEMNSFSFIAMSETSSGEEIYSENIEMVRYNHTPMEESSTLPLDMMGYLAMEEEVFNPSEEDLPPIPSWYSTRNQQINYEMNSCGYMAMSYTSSGEDIYSENIEMVKCYRTPMEERWTTPSDMMGYLAVEEEVFNPSDEDLQPSPSWYSAENEQMDYEMNSFGFMAMSYTSSGEEIYSENIEMIRFNHKPMEKSWTTPSDIMGYLAAEEEVFNPSEEDLPPIPSWYSTRNQQMDYEMNSFDLMPMSYTSSGVEIRYNHIPMEESWTKPSDIMGYLPVEEDIFNPSDEDLPPFPSWYSTGCDIVSHVHAPSDINRSQSPDILLYIPKEEGDFNPLHDEMPLFTYWPDTGCEIVKHIHAPSDISRSQSPDILLYIPKEEGDFNPLHDEMPLFTYWPDTGCEIVKHIHAPSDISRSQSPDILLSTPKEEGDFNPLHDEMPLFTYWPDTGCEIVKHIHAPSDISRSQSPDILLYTPKEEGDFNPLHDEMPLFTYWPDTGCEIVKHIRAPSDDSRSTTEYKKDFPEEEEEDSSDDDQPPIHQDPEEDKNLFNVSSLNLNSWMDEESTEDSEVTTRPRRWSLRWMRLGLRRMTGILFSCCRQQQVE
ncbi:uncharacterized protein [Engystomops pustulosus]|uniref:uncharacterized protein isoform X2 n=1 Tax=Engystomops pustulosus TaxID=76066 RepID=UPI003AFAD885